jgi:hypothetical protein
MMELVFACLPSLITGVFLFMLQKRIDRQEKNQEERDILRNKYIKLIVDLTLATHALSEANAVALKNGKTNGETERALAYAREIKYKHRDFLELNGIKNLF